MPEIQEERCLNLASADPDQRPYWQYFIVASLLVRVLWLLIPVSLSSYLHEPNTLQSMSSSAVPLACSAQLAFQVKIHQKLSLHQ